MTAASSTISIDKQGVQTVEHWHFVDLAMYPIDPIGKLPCCRAIICTHFPKSRMGRLMDQLMDRGLVLPLDWKVKHFGKEKAWMSFTVRATRQNGDPWTAKEIDTAVKRLLNLLETENLEIIWKEGRHGYTMKSSGWIKRRWSLDPF